MGQGSSVHDFVEEASYTLWFCSCVMGEKYSKLACQISGEMGWKRLVSETIVYLGEFVCERAEHICDGFVVFILGQDNFWFGVQDAVQYFPMSTDVLKSEMAGPLFLIWTHTLHIYVAMQNKFKVVVELMDWAKIRHDDANTQISRKIDISNSKTCLYFRKRIVLVRRICHLRELRSV